MGVAGTDDYFYYETTRKMVAVFGAFFNDIFTGRKLSDGSLTNMARVPLSYGPRSKFLARINEDVGSEISIKLPRMSFELSDISYDSASKVNPHNRRKFCVAGSDVQKDTAYSPAPYNLTFELNIFARTQDDALQILEQILPVFTPEYTVSISDMEGPGTKTDVPFVLSGIALSDEWEGDWAPARPIVYTLTFDTKARYLGGLQRTNIIERTMINFRDKDSSEFLEKVVARGVDAYGEEILDDPITFISDVNPDDEYVVRFSSIPSFTVGENMIGKTSGYAGVVKETINDGEGHGVIIHRLENLFESGETLLGEASSYEQTFTSIELYIDPYE
jgi:hypothetical protein